MKVLTSLEQEEIDYPSGDEEPMAESDLRSMLSALRISLSLPT